ERALLITVRVQLPRELADRRAARRRGKRRSKEPQRYDLPARKERIILPVEQLDRDLAGAHDRRDRRNHGVQVRLVQVEVVTQRVELVRLFDEATLGQVVRDLLDVDPDQSAEVVVRLDVVVSEPANDGRNIVVRNGVARLDRMEPGREQASDVVANERRLADGPTRLRDEVARARPLDKLFCVLREVGKARNAFGRVPQIAEQHGVIEGEVVAPGAVGFLPELVDESQNADLLFICALAHDALKELVGGVAEDWESVL